MGTLSDQVTYCPFSSFKMFNSFRILYIASTAEMHFFRATTILLLIFKDKYGCPRHFDQTKL